jgi:peptidylprolyl isomerase
VGTEKRERQKSNRQQRLHQEAKVERAGAIKRSIVRWTAGILAAIGAVVLIAWAGGAFDSDDTGTAEPPTLTQPLDTVPVDTVPVDTTPVPPKPEVQIPDELPTELVVTTLSPGEGPAAVVGDTVEVHYVGVRSEDGVEFDNSYDRGSTYPVSLGSASVIQGWEDGLVGAQAGSQIQLDIPAELAYGDTGSGDVIRPGDAITFVIDVVSVTPAGS